MRAGEIRPSASLVKGDGQPSNCLRERLRGFTVHPPSWALAIRANLHHAAQLGNHIQALLLAQVLGAHDCLLVQQVAGPGLLLEVTFDHVYGPVHVLAGNLTGLLVGDGHRHLYTHLLPVADSTELVTFDPPSLTPGLWRAIPLSRRKLGFLCWPSGRRLAGPPGPCNPPDEGIADEARHDGHRVLREAELNVLLVPETFQPPRRTVVPQRAHGARQITLDYAPGPPVQISTTRPQPVEDSSRRSLILGDAATLPAAPDNNYLCAIVGPSGQLLSQDTGVDEGTCQDGPGAPGGLDDARSVRSRECDLGAWRYL